MFVAPVVEFGLRGRGVVRSGRCSVVRRAEIHEAVKVNDRAKVETLLGSGVGVDEVDEEGWTGMMWAARVGADELAELFYGKGASIRAKNAKGSTPLHHACHFGSEKIVEKLLGWLGGSEGVDDVSSVGWTPLHWAARLDMRRSLRNSWMVELIRTLETSLVERHCTRRPIRGMQM